MSTPPPTVGVLTVSRPQPDEAPTRRRPIMSLTFMAPRLLADPRRLRAAFLVVMLFFTATLAWLAWTLVEQNRELQATRLTDAREAAADLIAAALDRRLSTLVQQLDRWAG